MPATILVAEDNDILRHVLTSTLQDHGYTVTAVRSAAEALAVLRAGRGADLVIADVGVGVDADPAVIAELRDVTAMIPLLYISGYPQEEAAERFAMRPGASFLAKPFVTGELLAMIRSLLASLPGPDVA